MRARVRAALGDEEWRGGRLVVAASGGVDSMVLLHQLASLGPELGFSICAGHVHHGLREEADGDAACVAAAARELGVDYLEQRVDPRGERAAARASRSRPSLQEAARRLRYRALGQMAREAGARAVATAHHRDDQVETLLLRLMRGTGPDGASGIRAQRVWPRADDLPAERALPPLWLLRPLLDVSRSEILEFATARGVSWREDHSNSDPHYARNRLRNEWLPGLREAFNPQLDRALAGFAAALAEERTWLESLEDGEVSRRFEALENGGLRVDIKDWDELPRALARRLVRRALREIEGGREITGMHLERMMDFFSRGAKTRAGKTLEVPGGIRVRFDGDRDSPSFRLERAPLPPSAGC